MNRVRRCPSERTWRAGAAAAVALLLAACASTSPPLPRGPATDGPGTSPPPNLAAVPDAEPRIEPIRNGGPNKPYEVLGRDYVPMTVDRPHRERGIASWYGRKFHGRRTANGEVYDMYAMTAAHKTLPLPSYVRVRNPKNGREVVVRVNDRGPFVAGRIIDLSYTAALKLDLLRGIGPVEIERITFDEIRAGMRLRSTPPPEPAVAATAPAAAPTVLPPSTTSEPVVAAAAAAPVAAGADEGAPRSEPSPSLPLPGWWVQLGAFREREGAEAFSRHVGAELEWLAPRLAIHGDAALWRLQAGPYASRDEARAGAERVRESLQLVPVVVERR